MAINILVGTVKAIFNAWEETKLLGQVAKKNKIKTAFAVLAMLPFCAVLAAPFIQEYRNSRKKRREKNEPKKEPI